MVIPRLIRSGVVLQWTVGALLCCAVALWATSGWHTWPSVGGRRHATWRLEVACGRLEFFYSSPVQTTTPLPWNPPEYAELRPTWRWIPEFMYVDYGRVVDMGAALPLWIPASIAMVALALFRRWSRSPSCDTCSCGYSRVGLTSTSVCPECGQLELQTSCPNQAGQQ